VTTTFSRAAEAAGGQPESRQESAAESVEWRALALLEQTPLSRSEIAAGLDDGQGSFGGHGDSPVLGGGGL